MEVTIFLKSHFQTQSKPGAFKKKTNKPLLVQNGLQQSQIIKPAWISYLSKQERKKLILNMHYHQNYKYEHLHTATAPRKPCIFLLETNVAYDISPFLPKNSRLYRIPYSLIPESFQFCLQWYFVICSVNPAQKTCQLPASCRHYFG